GNGDGLFMATVVKAAMNVWRVRGLILDLSALSYEWGNGLANVLVAGKTIRGVNFPTAVVVSEKCGPALESLGPWYQGHFMSGGQKQWLFDDVDSALRHIEAQADAVEAEEEQKKKNIILWPK
ncbi:MAG TPA: hypothetical protein VM095_14335, partial [Pyrinomonadaceae bacterium]|nr:hypothetical protein [Pyrinomonadaceae bacterium]